MLLATILVPLVGALFIAVAPPARESTTRLAGACIAAVPLALLVAAWLGFEPAGPWFQHVIDLRWIPAAGVGLRLGVDGISLALAVLSALLYVAAIAYPTDYRGKAHQYVAWMLFLDAVSVGFFEALDLLLFYVFFDLSLVGMYFLIALWGHEQRAQAALKFIIYTLAGSLVMLLGILSLALSMTPISFDMRALIAAQPLSAQQPWAGLTLLALLFGMAVKTPLVPLHTWLPAAHVEAPAPASAILAGVLLKMGTYGMIRVPFAMMRGTFHEYAAVLGVAAVLSIVYGAFVAFGQRHIKRRIAYTSVTHMGYTVLGIAAAAWLTSGRSAARRLALTGATLEMVAHGLITGALFLIAGSIWKRGRAFDMDAYGGLAARAPRLTAAAVIAALASLGLPALAGFVAEFQIFTGTLAVAPWYAGSALLGMLITAALFLQLLQVVFFGEGSRRSREMTDLGAVESGALLALLGLTVFIGVAPAFIVELIGTATRFLVGGP